MKVIFVGIHNKPGMKPLDSRTMTGKVIDAITDGLNCDFRKTNLCNVEYFPTDEAEINKHAINWHEINQPAKADVVVLLGQWVQKHFLPDFGLMTIVKLGHPAGVFGPVNKAEYITNSIQKIKAKIINP